MSMDTTDKPAADGSSEGVGPLPERAAYARWVDASNSRALRILDADGAHAAGYAAGVAAERERWRELADHLRHCRECGEMDVAHCHEGAALWQLATGDDLEA